MRNPKTSFELNIRSVKEIDSLHKEMQKLLPAMDLSEMLRAEHVLVVSALDCYVHDIVRTKMKKMVFDNVGLSKLPTNFCSFPVSLVTVTELINSTTEEEKEAIITKALKDALYKFSFESEKTIEKAMGYIGVKKLWSELESLMGMKPENIKRQLSLIVRRRNNIAHQSDITNLTTMEKDEMLREDIENTIVFIEKLVSGIDTVVHNQIPS